MREGQEGPVWTREGLEGGTFVLAGMAPTTRNMRADQTKLVHKMDA